MYVAEVYRSADGWRWRIVARNGRTIADSGEAYSRKGGALEALQRLVAARIEVEVQP